MTCRARPAGFSKHAPKPDTRNEKQMIKQILALLGFKKTVASITKNFGKALAELESHAEDKAREEFSHIAKKAHFDVLASVARDEAQQAKALAANFKSLLNLN
jgi:hypothetical protein